MNGDGMCSCGQSLSIGPEPEPAPHALVVLEKRDNDQQVIPAASATRAVAQAATFLNRRWLGALREVRILGSGGQVICRWRPCSDTPSGWAQTAAPRGCCRTDPGMPHAPWCILPVAQRQQLARAEARP